MNDFSSPFFEATNGLTNPKAATVRKGASEAEIEKAAADFEAVFLSQFIENMFAGIKTDGMFGGGQGEQMFRSLMVQEYGKILANNGGIGLSDSIKRDMMQLQEVNAK